MRTAIIGGSGFVGTRLIELLLNHSDNQYECKNIDLCPSHFFNEITVIDDVRDREAMVAQLKGFDLVILIAAQHRDDVTPVSLYYETNVGGMENTLHAMEVNGIKRLIFLSSVSVYGLNKPNPDENFPPDPFNDYGRSKWQAEQTAREWWEKHQDWNIDIIRPTVIFGERNRGNVYNLLHQIQGGRFLMVGKGTNRKSMAYVGNVVAFIRWTIENVTEGYNVFNYVDKPDMDMNSLVSHVSKVLNRKIPTIRLPYWIGLAGGYGFDLLAALTGKKLTVSSIRVKKFCASTEVDGTRACTSGFIPPYTLAEGLARTLEFEFLHPQPDNIVFVSE